MMVHTVRTLDGATYRFEGHYDVIVGDGAFLLRLGPSKVLLTVPLSQLVRHEAREEQGMPPAPVLGAPREEMKRIPRTPMEWLCAILAAGTRDELKDQAVVRIASYWWRALEDQMAGSVIVQGPPGPT